MIGNRLDPRQGLAALCEGLSRGESNFEVDGVFLRAFSDTPTLPAVGLLTTQSTRGLIHDLNIELRIEEERRNGTVPRTGMPLEVAGKCRSEGFE